VTDEELKVLAREYTADAAIQADLIAFARLIAEKAYSDGYDAGYLDATREGVA
jgi:hypothetical protein